MAAVLALGAVGCGDGARATTDAQGEVGDTVVAPEDATAVTEVGLDTDAVGDADAGRPPWRAELRLEPVVADGVASASRLRAAWTVPPIADPPGHVRVVLGADGDEVTVEVSGQTEADFVNLRSDTTYRARLEACLDPACAVVVAPDDAADPAPSAATAREVWRLLGAGHAAETVTRVVADGNTKAQVLLLPASAGASAGHLQLYYDPMPSTDPELPKGVALAVASEPAAFTAASLASFTRLAGYGFRRDDQPGVGHGPGPATFQVVPMRGVDGASDFVRLFFEGEISGEAAVQVYSVDSVDALGRDFNQGAATLCTGADTTFDGLCPITLAVGAAARGNPGVDSARQAKVVYPSLDDPRWDGAVGTPMIVTLHLDTATRAACGADFFNAGYAVWDGAAWVLEYDAAGVCPRLWPGVQAPMPVHLGGTRYALYFNDHHGVAPNQKPMRILYGDAARTGDPAILDFDDWEPVAAARDLDTRWPDGTALTVDEESRFDDHVVFAPTGTPDERVIFTNFACASLATCPPFITGALLTNP